MSVKRFRPVPLRLKAARVFARQKEHARFYGNYVTMTGKPKRFSFSVKISRTLSNRKKSTLIRAVVSNILERKVPVHVSGQRFKSFKVLLRKTPWFQVKKILNYEAGMVYVR